MFRRKEVMYHTQLGNQINLILYAFWFLYKKKNSNSLLFVNAKLRKQKEYNNSCKKHIIGYFSILSILFVPFIQSEYSIIYKI